MESNTDLVRCWAWTIGAHDVGDADRIGADAFADHAIAPFGGEKPGRVDRRAHRRATAGRLIGGPR